MGPRRRTAVVVLLALAATTLTAGGVAATPQRVAAVTAPAHTSVRGEWQVRDSGDGRYVVSWTSPTRFPMTSDRPTIVGPEDVVVGVPATSADQRTVHALVSSSSRPDSDDFSVVLSGDRLDVRGDRRARSGTASAPSADALDLPGTVTLPDDPATPGPYDVVSSDYELDPVKLAGMPQPVEMVGHVVEPVAGAATGPRPLVLFLHGRHSVCFDPDDPSAEGEWPCRPPMQEIPSQLGYDYIQQVLASQGYATVSVRVNGINAQDYRFDDGGADARAQVVERHLDHWTEIAGAHQVDLSRVVLVGHSRGGEGVDRASIEIPLSAPYRIVGQVLIAPTDFGSQTAAYVPTVTLLPYCDGDVGDLQGQKFTDTARDLAADDTALKSSVLVMGANHNFFNTEWTPGIAQAPAWDDWGDDDTAACGTTSPDRLSATQQRAVGTAYVAGAVHLFADDEQDLLPLFDGSRARVASMGTAQALSHAVLGGRDERAPRSDTSLSLPDGAGTRFCRGTAGSDRVASCTVDAGYGYVFPHWSSEYDRAPARQFFEMTWTEAGQSGGLLLHHPLDLTDRRLELRTIVDPAGEPADLRVRITDSHGASAVLTPEGGGVVPDLDGGRRTAKLWAQTVAVDPSPAAVDLAHIRRVDLVAQSAVGRIWVADLAAAPEALPSPPARRLPTIDVGSVQIPEGDDGGRRTAYLPFDVVGDLTRPAQLTTLTTGEARGEVQRFTVDLAPGQTSGRIPVGYTPDRLDDRPKTPTQVTTWAGRNVMTDGYLGRLTVLDDDPTPRITVRPASHTVSEGDVVRWQVTLARAVDYDVFVSAMVVRGRAPRIAAEDVGRRWVRRHLGVGADLSQPLWRFSPVLFERIRPGRTSVELTLPIARDRLAEPRESVTVKVRGLGRPVVRAVHVARSS